jgi:hypothetical protein
MAARKRVRSIPLDGREHPGCDEALARYGAIVKQAD